MPTHPFALTRRRVLGGLALGAAGVAGAQGLDLNELINKAGRQRMLSQRMVKAWLALGQGLDGTRADRVLGDSMALFERQLTELRAAAPSETIRGTYAQLDAQWRTLRQALVGAPPAQGAAAELLALDGRVLALAHQGTQQLEQQAGRPLGKLVNLAGRQRMLSQRLAKLQLARSWQVSLPDAAAQIDAARSEFATALDRLAAAPETTPAIQDELVLARQQWILFSAAILRGSTLDSQEARHVFIASENLLQLMDRITGLYARAAA